MKKGFTLVELQVSIAIFVVLSAGLYQVLGTGMAAYMVESNTLTLRQELRNAMDRFVREVRESKSYVVMKMDDNGDKISFDTFDKNGVAYYRDADQLLRRYPVTTLTPVAQHITYFKLAFEGDLLRVEMHSEQEFFHKMLVASLTEKVRLRNE